MCGQWTCSVLWQSDSEGILFSGCLCVRPCVIMYKKFVNMIYHKPLVGISPNLQLKCTGFLQSGKVREFWGSQGKQRGSGKSQGILKYHSLDQLFMLIFTIFVGFWGLCPRDGPNIRLWHSAEAEGLGRLTERVPNVRPKFRRMLCARMKQRLLLVSALSG